MKKSGKAISVKKRATSRRVCFRQREDVHEFAPVSDPLLKKKLYYSRRDLMTMELKAKCMALEYKLKKLKRKKDNIKDVCSRISSSLYYDPKRRQQIAPKSLLLMLEKHYSTTTSFHTRRVQELQEKKQILLEHRLNMLQRLQTGSLLKENHEHLRRVNHAFIRNNFLKQSAAAF